MSVRPGSYTHGHHESVLRAHRWRTVENSAAYLLPHLHPGQSLLDVGCGPGTITRDLAERLAPGVVVGIDPSEEAVAAAVAVSPPPPAEGSGTGPRHLAIADDDTDGEDAFDFGAGAGVPAAQPPRFEVADVRSYAERQPSDRFDVVHAHQVLQHVADPVGLLRDMGAMAVPGGLVAARDSDYSSMAWFPILPELDEWRRLYLAVARANGGEPDAGRRLLSWARAAGYAEISASASSWCFVSAEDRAWWGGAWADRILESELARQLVDAGLAGTDDLARIAAGWRRWALAPDGWFAVLHGEIICRTPGGREALRA